MSRITDRTEAGTKGLLGKTLDDAGQIEQVQCNNMHVLNGPCPYCGRGGYGVYPTPYWPPYYPYVGDLSNYLYTITNTQSTAAGQYQCL